jgi:hypothetical protein
MKTLNLFLFHFVQKFLIYQLHNSTSATNCPENLMLRLNLWVVVFHFLLFFFFVDAKVVGFYHIWSPNDALPPHVIRILEEQIFTITNSFTYQQTSILYISTIGNSPSLLAEINRIFGVNLTYSTYRNRTHETHSTDEESESSSTHETPSTHEVRSTYKAHSTHLTPTQLTHLTRGAHSTNLTPTTYETHSTHSTPTTYETHSTHLTSTTHETHETQETHSTHLTPTHLTPKTYEAHSTRLTPTTHETQETHSTHLTPTTHSTHLTPTTHETHSTNLTPKTYETHSTNITYSTTHIKLITNTTKTDLTDIKFLKNGNFHTNSSTHTTNTRHLPSFVFSRVSRGSEPVTIKKLWNYCLENPNDIVWYLHDKGAYHPTESNHILRSILSQNVLSSQCYDEVVSKSDACGMRFTDIPHRHFPGNMWIAKCSYIRLLPDPTIGRGVPCKQGGGQLVVGNYRTSCLNHVCLATGRFYIEHWIGYLVDGAMSDCLRDSGYIYGKELPKLKKSMGIFTRFGPQCAKFRPTNLQGIKSANHACAKMNIKFDRKLYGTKWTQKKKLMMH